MTKIQNKNLLIIFLIGVILFLVFFWPNGQNAATEQMLLVRSQDEPVIYPYILKMLSPSQDIHEAWGKLIIYGDYHYGYPFYFLSFLVLLPVKGFFGDTFSSQTQLNLMLLRQFISVLPMLISIGLMVFLQTRFRSLFKSTLLFCFLFCIGGIFRNNINWWHPDALAVLALVLTLFFLDRDDLTFGKNFYLAAVFCGIATAIKLQGIFFAPAILIYLGLGCYKKRLNFGGLVKYGVGFLLVMSVTFVLSNPFLLYSGPRERYLEIMLGKNNELSLGYSHDNPIYYQIGPYWWLQTLNQWYGQPLLWIFTSLSLLLGCWKGKRGLLNRMILLFFIPYSLYLLYFIAPKPDHYWLPVVLPFFSTILNIPLMIEEGIFSETFRFKQIECFLPSVLRKIPILNNFKLADGLVLLMVYGLVIFECYQFINHDIQLFFSFINKG